MSRNGPKTGSGVMRWRISLPQVAMVALGALVAGAYIHALFASTQSRTQSGRFATLIEHNGRVFSTDTQSRGYKLVVFGYTSCPDVCPLSLLKVREVLNALGRHGSQLVPLFITVDPGRDTTAVLAQYTAAIDKRILGITGPSRELRAFADAYGVLPAGQLASDQQVRPDHSATIYLLGRDNALLGMYNSADEVAAISADILRRTNGLASPVSIRRT
jgi:protein SCO1/2